MPIELLEGFLDEPLLLSIEEGDIRCLTNVCTHRGKILIEKPCKADLIRCGYHGRRFSLKGEFLSMPEFEGVENFPNRSDDLTELATAKWGSFLFTSIDPVDPFERFIFGIPDIDTHNLIDAKLVSERDYEVNAHWALYCENYLEGFHIPFVHKALNKVIEYGAYQTDTYRYSSLQTGFDSDGSVAGRYFFVFPNLMFNFYPWGISVNIVKPVSRERTIVRFLKYVTDESRLETGAGRDLHRVELEDEAVVESVQKGICSRFYDRGRYSPTRERGTHHFHQLIAEFLSRE
ncbi:MAG: SRPBCC family protein [Pyrinomonadaceae bacterium]